MSQPSFSYHFESARSTEEIWNSFLSLGFWQESWRDVGKHLILNEPLSISKKGSIVLVQNGQWSILITEYRTKKRIALLFQQYRKKITLSYELQSGEKTTVSITVSLDCPSKETDEIVSTLINPIITKHLTQLRAILTEPLPTIVSAPAPSKEKVEKERSSFLDQLDVQAGFRLWQLANLWQSKVRAVLKPYGLSPTQWLLLYSLVRLEKQHEPITPSVLSQALELNTMLVSDVITSLVKKHLVHKIKLLPDKRTFVISATAEGKITAIEAHTAVIQADKKFFLPKPLASIQVILSPKST